MENVNSILKKYWGIDELKDKQKELLTSFLENKDVVGLLPTGYGKSLCYLLPPLVTNKVIFIISPLISLMEDQKEKLIEMNIPVACLHGNNMNKQKEIFSIIDGEINIVYMSPEYMIMGDGFELADLLLKEDRLGFFAVDESHCISVWGHDFRDTYTKLYRFRKNYPTIPIMALTATATDEVIKDIVKQLNLTDPHIVIASFDRPNIYMKCKTVKKFGFEMLEEYIEKYEGHKMIVYMNSQKETVELSRQINSKYKNLSDAYHAGMMKNIRNNIQTKFNSGKINIIVSTVAFGMGIDQTVRCVVIVGSPKSVEEYYQMIGRAGRDGEAAESILFFQYQNIIINKSMLKKSEMEAEVMDSKINCLNKMARYASTMICRRRFILEYFGQLTKFHWCEYCDNCCEYDMIDMTPKIVDILFNKNKMDILKKSELTATVNGDLLFERNGHYIPTVGLNEWKRKIEVNKYNIKGVPKRYRLMCRK